MRCSSGFVSSGPIVLVLDMLLKSGPYYSAPALHQLFKLVALQTLAGLFAAVCIVSRNKQLLTSPDALSGGAKSFNLAQLISSRDKRWRTGIWGGINYPKFGSHVTAAQGVGLGSSSNGFLPGDPGIYAAPRHEMEALKGGYGQLRQRTDSVGHGSHNFDIEAHHPGAPSDPQDKKVRGAPLAATFRRIMPAACAIFLSVGTSMLVFPFFTHSKSTGWLGTYLPQVLFYVRLIGDIAGRVVPKRWQCLQPRDLMMWSLLKLALVPVLFLSIFKPQAVLGDFGAVTLVAVFWVLSGYINTCAYIVAPQLVPPMMKSRAAGLMALVFQSSCFIALLIALAAQKLLAARDPL